MGGGGAGSNDDDDDDDDDDFCFPVFCLVMSVVKEYLIVFHSHVCKRLMEFLEIFYKISGQKWRQNCRKTRRNTNWKILPPKQRID